MDIAGHTCKSLTHLVDDAHHCIDARRHHAPSQLHCVAGIGGVLADALQRLACLAGKNLQAQHHGVKVDVGGKRAEEPEAILKGCRQRLAEALHQTVIDRLAQRAGQFLHALAHHGQHGLAQNLGHGLPHAAQALEGAVEVVGHGPGRGLGAAACLTQLARQLIQRTHALVEQGAQRGPGLQAHGIDGALAVLALGGQLVQGLFKVGGDDAGSTQFLAKAGERVGKLTHDGVQRRARAAGVNACVGKLADDGDRALQAYAQGIGNRRGIAQRLGQPFHAGVGGVGALGQHIGHAAGIVKRQAHAHHGLGHVLTGFAQLDIARLGQGQHGRQRLDGVACAQTSLSQVFQSTRRLYCGVLGTAASILGGLGQRGHFCGRAFGGGLDAAHGRFKVCRAPHHACECLDAKVACNRCTQELQLAFKTAQHRRRIVLGVDNNLNGLEGHGVLVLMKVVASVCAAAGACWPQCKPPRHAGRSGKAAS